MGANNPRQRDDVLLIIARQRTDTAKANFAAAPTAFIFCKSLRRHLSETISGNQTNGVIAIRKLFRDAQHQSPIKQNPKICRSLRNNIALQRLKRHQKKVSP